MPIDPNVPIYLGNFQLFFCGFSLTPPGPAYLTGITGSMDMTANPTSGLTWNEILQDRLEATYMNEANSREITVLLEEREDLAVFHSLKDIHLEYENINNNYSMYYYITEDNSGDNILFCAELTGATMKIKNYVNAYINNDKQTTNSRLISGFSSVFSTLKMNDDTSYMTQLIGISPTYTVKQICDAYQTTIINP